MRQAGRVFGYGTNSIRLVPPGASNYRGLTFSRDGSYVYYVANEPNTENQNLYRVPAFGGSVARVRKDVDSPVSFSPDAKQYAFVRNYADKGEAALLIADANGTPSGLPAWGPRDDLAGEGRNAEREVAVRKFPERFSLAAAPAWSPDGKIIAVVTQTADANGTYSKLGGLDAATGGETQLSSRRWLEIGELGWLPDGTGLVLSGQDASSAFYHLWVLDYPSGKDRRITNDLNDYLAVSISSNPLTLLSVQRQTLTNIWTTSEGHPGQPVQLTSGGGRLFDLSWTSDGNILYASDASGNADIWEMSADGTNQKQLTAGAGRNYAPVASPDGKYIVFHSNRSGRWQLWRMGRDGSEPIQLTEGKEDSNWPEFSGDGRSVFYQHTSSGTPTLWKVSIDGGSPLRLTDTLAMRPSISRDGKSIAYWYKEQTPNAPWRIAVASLEGNWSPKFVDVPQSGASGQSGIQLANDGVSILFIDYRNGVSNLMTKRLDGSSPATPVTSFTRDQFYSFDESPNGRFVFSRGIRTIDAVMITEAR